MKAKHLKVTVALILFFLWALVLACKGAIGETAAQFEPRKPDKVGYAGNNAVLLVWTGKTLTHSGVFMDGIAFIEGFEYRDNYRMSTADLDKLLKPYLEAGLHVGEVVKDEHYDDYAALLEYTGTVRGFIRYAYATNSLGVFSTDAFVAMYPA
jgi:hypothetical protein